VRNCYRCAYPNRFRGPLTYRSTRSLFVTSVESRCGAVVVGAAYLLPALSCAGASLASPCFRFHIPLIEPDVRIARFRLSEKGSRCRPREAARPLSPHGDNDCFDLGGELIGVAVGSSRPVR